ncbi:transporter substrate-binding domain-containing protein [Methanocalculus sp.]|uniref:cache domain-containing protein n=1 Tax=Methanocalculus sp. TaxID=2004547 RepID=UPI00261DB663|nr:transporter substrate-binding domain-containing protein [Methanocalculus sp.]MDG6251483.1 transporter substrate-binding domain-containing protein [Methanocalculus sp.]
MKPISIALILGVLVLLVLAPGCMTHEERGEPAPVQTVSTDLTFLTENYPPFNYMEDGEARGILVDLLTAAFEEMGTPISPDQIQVRLWAYAYDRALSEENTAIFGTIRLPEREDDFKWAGPVISERKVIFAEKGADIAISGPADLNTYRIGVVQGDAATGILEEIGVDRDAIYSTGDVEGLIMMMEEDIIDLWCYGDLAGRHFSEVVTGDPDSFEVIYTLDSHDLYYAFNIDTPDSVVDAFQTALDTVRYAPDETGVTEYQRIVYRYVGVSSLVNPPVTAEEVTELVEFTAGEIQRDTSGTIARINAGEHPFWDSENRALYVFVYDTDLTIVAEADNPLLIGVNRKGKTDIAGTAYRDQIRKTALADGSGWVDYIWMIPEETGIYRKSAYFRLVEGSDGNQYIVVSGLYVPGT